MLSLFVFFSIIAVTNYSVDVRYSSPVANDYWFSAFEYSLLPVVLHSLTIIFCVVFLLGAIAYSTVFERKTIAVLQNRRGPNRAGFFGLFQAIGDGVKLVTKAQVSKKQTSLTFIILRRLVLYFCRGSLLISLVLACFMTGLYILYSFGPL